MGVIIFKYKSGEFGVVCEKATHAEIQNAVELFKKVDYQYSYTKELLNQQIQTITYNINHLKQKYSELKATNPDANLKGAIYQMEQQIKELNRVIDQLTK
jgi:chaperonin cofactor prefoldin